METYELIEHTADVGIRARGKTLAELFRNAALAMFDIMAQRKNIQDSQGKKINLKQKADNLDELFINWLNELLSLSATKELIFSGFKINRLDKNSLEATLIGRDISAYKVNVEIKAATYHALKIEQKDFGWQAEVIFDV